MRWSRPPGGEAVLGSELIAIFSMSDPRRELQRRLAERLGVSDARSIELRRSGRDALRSIFEAWQVHTDRHEIMVPAYTCYSVPAAAVAAGFRVRLVDVDLDGRIDLDALAEARTDRVAGLVVCNLFGRAEELGPLTALARSRGFELIDDAAQAFGARDAEGQFVGRRGFPSVLSFGRGKPLQGLGGGAVLGLARAETPDAQASEEGSPKASLETFLRAALLSGVWDASLTRPVFSLLSRIPALGIGQTEFDPGFGSGPIDPARAAIAAAQLASFDERTAARRARARALANRLERETGFVPLMDAEHSDRGVYSRLAVRAPHAGARERALVELAEIGAGASALYPNSLADVPELEPHRASPGDEDVPQSRALASRILTLPTNRTRDARELEEILRCLGTASDA